MLVWHGRNVFLVVFDHGLDAFSSRVHDIVSWLQKDVTGGSCIVHLVGLHLVACRVELGEVGPASTGLLGLFLTRADFVDGVQVGVAIVALRAATVVEVFFRTSHVSSVNVLVDEVVDHNSRDQVACRIQLNLLGLEQIRDLGDVLAEDLLVRVDKVVVL